METMRDLRMESNQEIETPKRTQTEMKMEWKTPVPQLGNPKESLAGRMDQAEDRTSGLKDEAEDLDQITKPNELIMKAQKKNTQKIQELKKLNF